jgi:acetyltransferase-like isoleucine patch superfamily enzyme
MLLKIISLFLPWYLKRRFLKICFSYELHPQAHIGLAWIFPKKLIMAAGAKVDHFTVAIHLDRMEMKENSTIGRSNWITGFPSNSNSLHFKHQVERRSELLMGVSSAITKDHHLDCTSLIEIGQYTTIAGYRSQFLTHSINVKENRQDSKPIHIGEYSFVGTNVVVLGGSTLPPRSVLGAKSLLNKTFTEEWMLYGGVPAKALNDIPHNAKYFSRTEGFVY